MKPTIDKTCGHEPELLLQTWPSPRESEKDAAAMTLTAHLCGVATVHEKDGYELIRRESVMELVTRWRMAWDAANKAHPVPNRRNERSATFADRVNDLVAAAQEMTDVMFKRPSGPTIAKVPEPILEANARLETALGRYKMAALKMLPSAFRGSEGGDRG